MIGLKIVPMDNWNQILVGMRTVRYPAHPIIRFLSRWFNVKPYVDAQHPILKDADPFMDPNRGIVYCSHAQADMIRRQVRELDIARRASLHVEAGLFSGMIH